MWSDIVRRLEEASGPSRELDRAINAGGWSDIVLAAVIMALGMVARLDLLTLLGGFVAGSCFMMGAIGLYLRKREDLLRAMAAQEGKRWVG